MRNVLACRLLEDRYLGLGLQDLWHPMACLEGGLNPLYSFQPLQGPMVSFGQPAKSSSTVHQKSISERRWQPSSLLQLKGESASSHKKAEIFSQKDRILQKLSNG